MLENGGFELYKWCANHPAILQNIPSDQIETGFTVEESGNKTIKTLGIYWQQLSDTFQFNISLPKPHNIITKRFILSDIPRIFHPIGLLSPVIFTAKLFMQEVWLIKYTGWDQPVPETLLIKWNRY